MLTMTEAKNLARTNLAAATGKEFAAETPAGELTGSIGVILPELSPAPHNKVQAQMSCIAQDCKNTHIRFISDWHQSRNCELHSKNLKSGPSGVGIRRLTFDGVEFTLTPIPATASPELRAELDLANTAYAMAKEAKIAQEAAEKATKAEARKTAQVQAKAERTAKRDAEKVEKLKARRELISKVAAEKSVEVSK